MTCPVLPTNKLRSANCVFIFDLNWAKVEGFNDFGISWAADPYDSKGNGPKVTGSRAESLTISDVSSSSFDSSI